MPFCLESEIDLTYFASEKAKAQNLSVTNTCDARSARSTKDSASSQMEGKSSHISMESKFKKIAFGLFKKAEKKEAALPEITMSQVEESSLVINSSGITGFRYQLNAFSFVKQTASKLSQEVVSYVKVKDNWFEFSGKGVKKFNDIDKLLQQSSNVPSFTSYRLQADDYSSLEKEELQQFISFGYQSQVLLEKMFYMPDNFINRFKYVDASCKQPVLNKFCQHNKLLPDYHDVVVTKSKHQVQKSENAKTDLQKKPTELLKNVDLLDGSFASLKYFATSVEIPLGLARKFIEQRESFAYKSNANIESLNYFQTCKDCLGKYRNLTLRRVLEKTLLFNFMKSGPAKASKKYLIDCKWFANYRDFLIPDLDLFGFKKYKVLNAEPPTLLLNSGVKQKLINYRSKNKNDSKISNEFFIAVDKRFFAYLQALYKTENCVMFDQKGIYIDNSEHIDINLNFTVEEKYVLDRIEALLIRGCDFDKTTQMQLHELNTKMNLYIEFAMDSSFKPLFQDIQMSREIIGKYLTNSLNKFVKFVDLANSDPAGFDPCKAVFSIFNKSKNSIDQQENKLSHSVFFGANSQVAKVAQQQQQELSASTLVKSSRKFPVAKDVSLMDSVLSGMSSQSKDKEQLMQGDKGQIRDFNSPTLKIQGQGLNGKPLHEYDLSQPGKLNDSNGSFYCKKETKDFGKGTSILMQSSHLAESNIIKLMNQSTLDRVYNNGTSKKQQETDYTGSLTGQALIQNISINTPQGRESISSTGSKDSKRVPKSLLRRNLGSIIKTANHINKLNESMGRNTIQLDDSFNYRFENSSFFSAYPSNRESANVFFGERDRGSQGPKKTDFRFSHMNVLADLSDNDDSRGSISEENSEPQRKDSSNSNDDELENENISEFASKLPKKSRFCNPRNIAVFRGSENGSSEESQSSDDEITEKLERHIAERHGDALNFQNSQLENIVRKNSKELIKSGLDIMILKNSVSQPVQRPQPQGNVVINTAKKQDNAPKALFVLNIVKDTKQSDDKNLINLSFSHASSKSESEFVSKPLLTSSLESSMVKSRVKEPIQEENSEAESSDEHELPEKKSTGKQPHPQPMKEGFFGLANENALNKKSMNEISGKNQTPVKKGMGKENTVGL